MLAFRIFNGVQTTLFLAVSTAFCFNNHRIENYPACDRPLMKMEKVPRLAHPSITPIFSPGVQLLAMI